MKAPFLLLILFSFSVQILSAQQDIEKRVESLLSQMTLEEKIGQLQQGWLNSPNYEEGIRDGKFGSFLNSGDIETKTRLQKIAVEESRLGIPLIFGRDVIHGYRTVLPIPLGLSATWNLDLVQQGCGVAAFEASQQGIHWTFAPMMDIARDARWGRIAESPGEDPYLVSRMGEAMIKGFQGEDLSSDKTIAACAKHFVGYGAAEGGRDYNTTLIPENELRNIYLPSFKAAKDAGVVTYMSAFNDLNGIPATGNKFVLREILRNEWGFNGFVVSDWASVTEMIEHGYVKDKAGAAQRAIEAGVDMEMVTTAYAHELANLIEDGKVDMKYIDEAVKNILRVKFALGLFDNPFRELKGENALLTDESLETARKAARESFVLLKNEGILPFKKDFEKIAIIGPLANSGNDQNGTWAPDGRGEDAVTPLMALKEKFGDKIIYSEGLEKSRSTDNDFTEAVKTAQQADAVILCLGEEEIISGEAKSRAFLNLPGNQTNLVKAIAETGKPIAIVIMAGRPLTFSEEAKLADAVLYAWHPGTMGGPALIDVLFGDYSPSGKLPVTFPRTVGQIPFYYNHRNTGRPATNVENVDIPLGTPLDPKGFVSNYLDVPFSPAYPFGYGLSYAEFNYDNLQISSDKIGPEDKIIVTCDVTNKSDITADEVVQLYIRDLVGSVTRPVKELKGFQKLIFQPGETKTVEFVVGPNELAFYNYENKLTVEPGEFHLWVGPNSAEGLQTSFAVE